jgi:Uma2 family endonuclease
LCPQVHHARSTIPTTKWATCFAREYWVIDRFRRTLTVFAFGSESDQERVIPENQNYTTPLLPGFERPLGRLLKLADRWAKKRP